MNLDDRRFLRELGQRLRQAREEQKMTQEDLGRKCSLHRTIIGSVERGERNVSILNLRLITKVLRISLSVLLSDEYAARRSKE